MDVNIFDDDQQDKVKLLKQLPTSCWDSAIAWKSKKRLSEIRCFTEGILEGVIDYLKAFKDKDLQKKIGNNPDEVLKLVEQFFHCG